ncbi:hypothetical protein BDP27DRAFT_1368872 [Rhodocollybia butyracea]|uniref:Uncharacterized protein n=1 Tax=Rhodocollybia butyracea TaxID=206335 RepID=A0A9P5PHY0_9AGAR|nr:hypothetical protein BDP27DRAFT_1368872 [Rhodocollybia butyracea]
MTATIVSKAHLLFHLPPLATARLQRPLLQETAETSFSSAPGSRAPPSPEGNPGAFPLPSFGLVHPLLHTGESDALKAPTPDPQKPPRGDAAQLPLDQGKAARRKRKSQRKHEQRSVKRKVDQPAQPLLQKALKEVAHRHAAEAQTLSAGNSFSTEDLPVNKGAWSGLRQIFEKILPDIAALTVIDKGGRIIAVLAGKPRDDNWDAVMTKLTAQIKDAHGSMMFSKKQEAHKRGKFSLVAVGTLFGGGSKRPGTMAFYGVANRAILVSLIASSGFRHLVGFANSIFQCFVANTFGLCGGHMILWDLGLVIRFPPGSTILIPSALLTHSNVPIQPGEEHYSIIQYSSSGLFCWVYNGFQSDKDFMATAMPEMKMKREEDRKARWGNGLQMFSIWDDLCNQYTKK